MDAVRTILPLENLYFGLVGLPVLPSNINHNERGHRTLPSISHTGLDWLKAQNDATLAYLA